MKLSSIPLTFIAILATSVTGLPQPTTELDTIETPGVSLAVRSSLDSGNCKGSSNCGQVAKNSWINASNNFDDNTHYTSYTSFHNGHCGAIWTCDNAVDFQSAPTDGRSLKAKCVSASWICFIVELMETNISNRFGEIYGEFGCGRCGSVYFWGVSLLSSLQELSTKHWRFDFIAELSCYIQLHQINRWRSKEGNWW